MSKTAMHCILSGIFLFRLVPAGCKLRTLRLSTEQDAVKLRRPRINARSTSETPIVGKIVKMVTQVR